MLKQSYFSRWRQDRRASVAPLMAVGILALLIVAGGQADFAGRNAKEIAVQSAVDAAALAAALEPDLELDARDALVREVFNANISERDLLKIEDFALTVRPENDTIIVTAEGNYRTNFLPLVGLPFLRLNTDAVALNRVPAKPIEFVMVMDTTASILGSGAERAFVEDAVRDTFRVLLDAQKNGLEIVPSFLPFNDRVNFSEFNTNSGTGDVDPFSFGMGTFPVEGNGCFEPRETPRPGFPFALDDTPPTLGNRFEHTDTFSTIGLAGRDGDGIDDPSTPVVENASGDAAALPFRSPLCPPQVAVNIKNLGQINSTLASLVARGTGRFDVALAWGWRMLSPRWRGEWKVNPDYPGDASDTRKVLALLTDGHSNAWRYEAGGSGGNFAQPTPNNQITDDGFAHIVDLCSRMKASGIEVRVILAFTYDRARIPFEQCASPGQFFEVTTREEFVEQIRQLSTIARETRLVQ